MTRHIHSLFVRIGQREFEYPFDERQSDIWDFELAQKVFAIIGNHYDLVLSGETNISMEMLILFKCTECGEIERFETGNTTLNEIQAEFFARNITDKYFIVSQLSQRVMGIVQPYIDGLQQMIMVRDMQIYGIHPSNQNHETGVKSKKKKNRGDRLQ